MSEFAARLRDARSRAGLTQAELAERARISERTVSDIERGLRQGVYAVTARQLAEALGLEGHERASFEAQARLRQPRSDVPAQDPVWRGLRRTALIGREQELNAVTRAIASPDVRLLTITGMGGIGKTRLVAEACAQREAPSDGPTFVVQLANLRDPALMIPTIAHALGIAESGSRVVDNIVQYLSGRHALLVLDSFEPILEAAAEVGELVDRVADMTALITSRAPLRVRGERELPLGPLAVRPAGLHSTDAFAAEQLFTERALAVRSDLLGDGSSGDAIADICRRLSGVPLALELAAARVRHMSLRAVGAQLHDPLALLAEGDRDLPERQRTMRATIAWSHDLLWPAERLLFQRLAWFSGGWTLDAAEAVAGFGDLPVRAVFDALGRLAERSLTVPDDQAAAPRWRMLDPIRQFAAEQLTQSGEEEPVARRHADFYAALAEHAEPSIRTAGQAAWIERLRDETGNLRVALQWSISQDQASAALRLVAGLWMFWRLDGAFGEGASWLDAALGMHHVEASSARLRALWGAAWLAYQRGDHERAVALAEELEGAAQDARFALDRRNALTIRGHVAIARGQAEEAVPMLEEALEICRRADARWHVATSQLNLGTALVHSGDRERAEQLLHAAVAAFEAEGDRHFAARASTQLGYLSLADRDFGTAKRRFAAAMRRFLELEETWGTADALDGLAACAAAQGELERAAHLYGAARGAYSLLATAGLGPDIALAQPWIDSARAAFGDTRWKHGQDQGAAMSIDAATQLALSDDPLSARPDLHEV